jgi:hypothetical protein
MRYRLTIMSAHGGLRRYDGRQFDNLIDAGLLVMQLGDWAAVHGVYQDNRTMRLVDANIPGRDVTADALAAAVDAPLEIDEDHEAGDPPQ